MLLLRNVLSINVKILLSSLLALTCSSIISQELSIGLFYDDQYVDTRQNSSGEAFALKNFLESIDYEVVPFDGIDSASIFDGISCHEVIFLPETELGDFANSINSNGGGDVLREYVNTGGLLFIMGSDGLNQSSSNSAENINAIFDYNLENAAFTSSGFTYLNEDADISFRRSLPDSVRSFTTTNFVKVLPVDAQVLYSLDEDKSCVVQMPYGVGNVVYLGWSFFDGGPVGNQGPDRWSNLIQILIREWSDATQYPDCFSCDTRAPYRIASNQLTRYLDQEGNVRLTESDFRPLYDDNCGVFSIETISNDLLNCSNAFNQEVYLRIEDNVGNHIFDTLSFELIDTVQPEFVDFPNDVTIECNYDSDAQVFDSVEIVHSVAESLNLDSLGIYSYTISSGILPTGSSLERIEFYVNGNFNSLSELWIRVKDELGNSSLLFNGSCAGESEIDAWFSIEGVDLDCNSINDSMTKFVSINGDLGVFAQEGEISPNYIFDILNLGQLEGVIASLGIKIFFTSDLRFPIVEEACGHQLIYNDVDNRTDCPTGIIIRTFQVTDLSGNSNERSQVIHIEDSQEVEISYPTDYFITCSNGINYFDSLLPEYLPVGFGEPEIADDCRMYEANYSDRVVNTCGMHHIEIERTWIIKSDCEPGIQYQHRQKLGVVDDQSPVIDSIEPYLVFVDDVTCLSGGNFYFPDVDDLVIHDCSDNISIDMRVIDSLGVQFREDELMAGNYFVEISATDPCGNKGIRLVPVELVDVSPPSIQCISNVLEVPLNQLGEARICGSILLDNVEENCSIARYQMSFSPTFNNSDGCLEIDCDDLTSGSRIVYVRAEDVSGNADVCTARISVVDNEPPQLLCGDIILSCNESFDPINYPVPVAVDNCDPNPKVTCLPFRFMGNECDSTFSRWCQAEDSQGNLSMRCTQYLSKIDTFTTSVIWPEELVELNCGGDTEPSNTGEPIILASCGSFVTTYSDNRFSLCGVSNLYGIDRRWTVSNSCTQESFRFDQQVLVTDLDPPVFTYPTDSIYEVEIIDFDCETFVSIIPEAIDQCTNDVIYSNSISGSVREFSGSFEIGDHSITFYAEDLCGNVDSLEIILRITENKNPFVSCEQGLNFFMNQAEFVDIYPEDILDTAFDLCTPHSELEYYISKILPNGQDIGRQPRIRFECRDLGLNPVRLFARDASKNISVCDVQINIIDTFRVCPDGDFYDISGRIFDEGRIIIGGATAYVDNNALVGFDSGKNGNYLAKALPRDSVYEVRVEKDFNYDNGVTALDLALIQQNQLQLRQLGSPYKIIAADVNNDEKLSVLDLITIRSLLLGVISEFPDVPSWKFIPENFEFVNPFNPFEVPIDYADTVLLGGKSVRDLNFIGMKMGDVNNSAEQFLVGNRTSDRGSSIPFDIYFEYLKNGRVKVDVELPNDWISGQMYLTLNWNALSEVQWNLEGIRDDLYYLDSDRNSIHFVWSAQENQLKNVLSFTANVASDLVKHHKEWIGLREDLRSLGAKNYWEENDIELRFIERISPSEGTSSNDCVSIVPTPWKQQFEIVSQCEDLEWEVMKIFGSDGRLVKEVQFSPNEALIFDDHTLDEGFYLVELREVNGETFYLKTIKSD